VSGRLCCRLVWAIVSFAATFSETTNLFSGLHPAFIKQQMSKTGKAEGDINSFLPIKMNWLGKTSYPVKITYAE
jgi:hypothetical protein